MQQFYSLVSTHVVAHRTCVTTFGRSSYRVEPLLLLYRLRQILWDFLDQCWSLICPSLPNHKNDRLRRTLGRKKCSSACLHKRWCRNCGMRRTSYNKKFCRVQNHRRQDVILELRYIVEDHPFLVLPELPTLLLEQLRRCPSLLD